MAVRGERDHSLTDRELQVIAGGAEGLSMAEIGKRMFVTYDTVKTHFHRAYAKLGARNRAHALTLCIAQNYLTVTPEGHVKVGTRKHDPSQQRTSE